jgi:PucR family transcriptional regulator, purine catabolism regulatory protein
MVAGSNQRSRSDVPDSSTVTIRDLLDVPELGLRLLAAPEHADTSVRWAHPTELLDPRRYLSGGELVLTVGASLGGDESRCRTFVDHLLERDVSALGYGVGDVTVDVPPALVAVCRERELPLLEVPPGIPFQAITELLAERRVAARLARDRRTQQLATRLLDAVAKETSLEDLLRMVAEEIGGHVDYREGRLSWTPTTATDVAPSPLVLEHIEKVLAVRQHEHDVAFAQRRAEAGRLLGLVLERRADPEVLRDVLTDAGLEPGRPVVVAAWPDKASDLLLHRIQRAFFADLPEGMVTITADETAVRAAARETAVSCGIATPSELADLASAVSTAFAALDLSRRRGAPVTHRELVSFEGLLEQQPPERLRPFTETLVWPLVQHDRAHGAGLVATLRAFLDGDGSVNATAARLYLHPNSLRHRLKRISELTGADPRAFTDRVALAIALWAWDRRPRSRDHRH